MSRNLIAILLVVNSAAAGDSVRSNDPKPRECGSIYAQPFASQGDRGRRKCLPATPRKYKHHREGLGFEILDAESEACFVGDDSYRLLDDIIDTVLQRVPYDDAIPDPALRQDQARRISKTISDVLAERGFGLLIPTETLGDALVLRSAAGEKQRHMFDCDTGSLIFLTVAENLHAPVSLVEITLPGGAGHNYVRWQLDVRTVLDWDLNGRAECTTPQNVPSYQGKSMSRLETLGYALTLRAELWAIDGRYDRAIIDDRNALLQYRAPGAYNNFAWLIATHDMPDRPALAQEGLAAAKQAVSIARTPNYLDTLGCAHALVGNFEQAIAAASGAGAGFPGRLALYQMGRDCTGLK